MLDNEMILKEIIEALKKIGIEGRGTQAAIAQICDLGKATISLWFNKAFPNQRPTLESLVKISLATGTSLDQLVFGQERRGKIPVFKLNDSLSHEKSTNIETILDPWERESGRYFAVRLNDNNMSSLTEKSYPKGRLMIFDRMVDASNLRSGVIVFAKVGDSPPFEVCRQFIRLGAEIRLVALNQKYSAEFDGESIEIKGVLVYSIEEEER